MFPFLPFRRTVPMPMPRVLCEPLAIWFQLPAGSLVFHRTVIVLKPGIAFFARFLLAAVFIEARNREPRPIGRCLASLGVEAGGKGEVFGKFCTIDLQVIIANAATIHPEAQTFVANELDGADGLINGLLLGLIDSQLVVVDEHAHPVCRSLEHSF